MKFSILALGAAMASISCVNQCAAQLIIESQPARAAEARLVTQTTDDFFGTSQPEVTTDESRDYFADDVFHSEASDPQALESSQPVIERSVLEKSVPVMSHGARGQAPLSVLANVPEVGMMPVAWPHSMGGCPTPNPVANMMTRNWCTEGLWDGYACESARQCQHIQHHVNGPNRYAVVGGLPNSGCGCAAAPGPVSGAMPFAVAPGNTPHNPVSTSAHALIGDVGAETHLVKQQSQPTSDFSLSSVELPADVPTVPSEAQRAGQSSSLPTLDSQPQQFAPANPFTPQAAPAVTPSVAARPAATLR